MFGDANTLNKQTERHIYEYYSIMDTNQIQ